MCEQVPELHGQRGMWNLCEYFNRAYLFLLKRLMMMSIRAKVSLTLRFIDDDLYSDRVELLLLIHVRCGENMVEFVSEYFASHFVQH